LKKKIYNLGRNEIIRGFGSFDSVLAKGLRVEAGHIAAFFEVSESKSDFPVKVGFLMSKKKLKNHTIETA